MERMLIGQFEHTIDAKGRINFPAKFREDMGDRFILTKGLDNCIAVYSLEEWERLAAAGALRHAVRNLRYFIFGIDPHRDAGQLAGAFEPRHIFSQVPIHLFRRIAPAADRTGTAATAARSPRRTGASGAGMGQRYAFRPEIGTARPLFRPTHPRTGAARARTVIFVTNIARVSRIITTFTC